MPKINRVKFKPQSCNIPYIKKEGEAQKHKEYHQSQQFLSSVNHSNMSPTISNASQSDEVPTAKEIVKPKSSRKWNTVKQNDISFEKFSDNQSSSSYNSPVKLFTNHYKQTNSPMLKKHFNRNCKPYDKVATSHKDQFNPSTISSNKFPSSHHNDSIPSYFTKSKKSFPNQGKLSDNTNTANHSDVTNNFSKSSEIQITEIGNTAMEVDEVEIVKEIRRNFKDVQKTQNSLSESLPQVIFQSNKAVNNEQVFIIVDTCAMIGKKNLILLEKLFDTKFQGFGYPNLVIPWIVFHELDVIKDNKFNKQSEETKLSAKKAIGFIHDLLLKKHPRLMGQNRKMDVEASENTNFQSNDDRVLNCCLQYQDMGTSSVFVLLTNDKNLCSKAIVSNVKSFSSKNITTELKNLGKQCSGKGFAIDLHKSSGKACQINNPKLPIRAEQNAEEVSMTIEDVISGMKTKICSLISSLIESECKNIYGEFWYKVLPIKPPWDIKSALKVFNRLWRAVFTFLFKREDCENFVKLEEFFKFGNENDWNVVSKNLRNVISSFNNFTKKSSYDELLTETVEELTLLEKECNKHVSSRNNRILSPVSTCSDHAVASKGIPNSSTSFRKTSDTNLRKTLDTDLRKTSDTNLRKTSPIDPRKKLECIEDVEMTNVSEVKDNISCGLLENSHSVKQNITPNIRHKEPFIFANNLPNFHNNSVNSYQSSSHNSSSSNDMQSELGILQQFPQTFYNSENCKPPIQPLSLHPAQIRQPVLFNLEQMSHNFHDVQVKVEKCLDAVWTQINLFCGVILDVLQIPNSWEYSRPSQLPSYEEIIEFLPMFYPAIQKLRKSMKKITDGEVTEANCCTFYEDLKNIFINTRMETPIELERIHSVMVTAFCQNHKNRINFGVGLEKLRQYRAILQSCIVKISNELIAAGNGF